MNYSIHKVSETTINNLIIWEIIKEFLLIINHKQEHWGAEKDATRWYRYYIKNKKIIKTFFKALQKRFILFCTKKKPK